MATYKIKMTWGDTLTLDADLSQASAPLIVDGESTQYQTADARHDLESAARLAVKCQGRDWWLDPSADEDEDEDGVDTYDGMEEDEYIDSRIRSIKAVEE